MIRKATIHDLEKIVTFNANLALETEGVLLNKDRLCKGVQALLNDASKGSYFVYEVNQQVVGQIMYTTEWSDWRNGMFWWIQSVYVHQDYRRQGIFKELYQHLKADASASEEVCGLRLYVEKENDPAKHTYQTLGMDETHYLLYEWEKVKS